MRKTKLGVIAAAICAILLIGSMGAYAYWSANAQVNSNKIASGHMEISIKDGVSGQAASAIDFSGLMPGQTGSKQYEIVSAANNPKVDVGFKVGAVTGNGTLKDNVKLAFLLQTDSSYAWWLTPSGPVTYGDFADTNNNPETNPAVIAAHSFVLSAYSGKIWSASPEKDNMPGYTNIGPGVSRHIKVYWTLPTDCSEDCHDSDAMFDMTFSLYQSH